MGDLGGCAIIVYEVHVLVAKMTIVLQNVQQLAM